MDDVNYRAFKGAAFRVMVTLVEGLTFYAIVQKLIPSVT